MYKILNQLINHKTIRQFKKESVPQDMVDKLLEVAQKTASSNGLQNFSIIHITDESVKEKLRIVGMQDYMGVNGELFIFIVDLFRNYMLAKENGFENDFMIDGDKFIQGFTDAAISCQNTAACAELMGLGINYFGNIQNDTEKIIEILKLPKYTFPVVGLGVGFIDQVPLEKPRVPTKNKVFENEYKIFSSYKNELKDYDNQMLSYYDPRDPQKRSFTFTQQIQMKQAKTVAKRDDVFLNIKKQGFKIKI